MTETRQPPRENLIRELQPMEVRQAAESNGMPTLVGHFSVFNRWTEINSSWEGRFMERIAPGAFTKTFKENGANMRVLLSHGQDPMVGDKPLGPIQTLREDEIGAYYEVPLLDTSYNRDLVPALEAGLYGASFRFGVMKESFNRKASESEHNPEGLPERTVQEARVREFGPTLFGAYSDATAGVRSLTDDYILRQLLGDPERLREFLQHTPTALPKSRAELAHSATESRIAPVQRRFQTQEGFLTWLTSRT